MFIYKATLETRHFDFEAYGATKLEALSAMRAGMTKHAQQSRISPTQFRREYNDSIECRQIIIGAVYRDGSEL